MTPAIIVIAYNRPDSILRLFKSLSAAHYLQKDVPLIISIDYQESENHDRVIEIATNFEWPFGEKKIIAHQKNLGLKKHVLSCGNLVADYESIIMLEDDIFVSPYFYEYASDALCFYQDSNEIAGISLYCHKKNFVANLPFELIPDSNDVFFLQIASSWGQAWTKKQWFDFRDWMSIADHDLDCLPSNVKNWPESSWLKHFIRYLILKNKYFVYPTKSLSTNFGDSGTHNLNKNVEYQVPLFMGNNYRFVKISNSFNVYDAFFEILPSRLKLLVPELNEIDFSVDLYGKKELKNISTKYLLSSKIVKNIKPKLIHSFGLQLKPMVLNVIFQIEGDIFKLNLKNNFKEEHFFFSINNPFIFDYFYTKIALKKALAFFMSRFSIKFKFFI